MNNRLWHEGDVECLVNGERKVAHYQAKVYDQGSEFGIDGGRISKLWIEIDGETVANYDREWDIKPEGDLAQLVYHLCNLYSEV